MMAEVAFADELREDGLIERRWMAVDEAASARECLYEPFRQHHESEAQGVEEHLRECAYVDDAARTVECLQRGQGMTEVAVLRVIFVLDDPCVRAGGPAKELHAAVRGHSDAH